MVSNEELKKFEDDINKALDELHKEIKYVRDRLFNLIDSTLSEEDVVKIYMKLRKEEIEKDIKRMLEVD